MWPKKWPRCATTLSQIYTGTKLNKTCDQSVLIWIVQTKHTIISINQLQFHAVPAQVIQLRFAASLPNMVAQTV